MSSNNYHLKPWEEALGILSGLVVAEGFLFAEIGNLNLILPIEMEDEMQSHIGRRIGILRTDLPDRLYLFRVFPTEKINTSRDD